MLPDHPHYTALSINDGGISGYWDAASWEGDHADGDAGRNEELSPGRLWG